MVGGSPGRGAAALLTSSLAPSASSSGGTGVLLPPSLAAAAEAGGDMAAGAPRWRCLRAGQLHYPARRRALPRRWPGGRRGGAAGGRRGGIAPSRGSAAALAARRPRPRPRRSAAPLHAAEGGQSRGGRAAAEAGGTARGWDEDGAGGTAGFAAARAERRVTLRQQRGREPARCRRPSRAPPGAELPPGAVGESSCSQPRRGVVRLASVPAGLLMER